MGEAEIYCKSLWEEIVQYKEKAEWIRRKWKN
jgi:hypothetical protein